MKLKQYLELTGISYAEIGKKTGSHPGTIYKIATYKQEPLVSLAKKISDACNGRVTIDDLSEYWITLKEAEKIYG